MSLVRLVPWIVHSAVEYAAAVLLLAAPFVFGFDSETAKWASIALGVVVLLVVALPLVGFVLARLPWRAGTHLDGPPPGSDPAAPLHATAPTRPTSRQRTTGHDEGDHR